MTDFLSKTDIHQPAHQRQHLARADYCTRPAAVAGKAYKSPRHTATSTERTAHKRRPVLPSDLQIKTRIHPRLDMCGAQAHTPHGSAASAPVNLRHFLGRGYNVPRQPSQPPPATPCMVPRLSLASPCGHRNPAMIASCPADLGLAPTSPALSNFVQSFRVGMI